MKMLVVFEKSAPLRFVGHLDLMRAMQRALRRSDLPVAFSKGFNPHLLLNFAAPLSVGMIGKREIMEVPLAADIAAEDFQAQLQKALPQEIPCLSVRAVDDRHPAPMAQLFAASYRVELRENAAEVLSAIPALLALEHVEVMRKTKTSEKLCNIRPMIYALEQVDDTAFTCTLALCEAATCKPELLMDALCAQAHLEARPRALYTRTQLFGKDFLPLEAL